MASSCDCEKNVCMNLFDIELSHSHLHLLLNHFPISGLLIAWLLLLGAAIFKQRVVIGAALLLVAFCGGMAYPVHETGERAEDKAHKELDKTGQHWLQEHGDRADKIAKACYVLAGLAIVGLGLRLASPKLELPIAWFMVILTLATLLGTVWVADAGGKIRHPDLRQPLLR